MDLFRFEQALLEAKAVDEEIEACENPDDFLSKKPFLGVPFTTKDCFEVTGLSHTAGLLKRGRRQQKAGIDADSVAQLRSAGGNSYVYIEKWTFKVMCEVCYRSKRDKKEAS